MMETAMPVDKLCIVCTKQILPWKRLFCSDLCKRRAYSQLESERKFIQSETDLANEIIKLEELLGKKKVVLDECHRQLAEVCRLEMCGYKN